MFERGASVVAIHHIESEPNQSGSDAKSEAVYFPNLSLARVICF